MADDGIYYPEILRQTEAFPASVCFRFYKRLNTKKSELYQTIILYMPEQCAQPSTISWETFSVLDKSATLAGNVASALAGLTDFTKKAASTMEAGKNMLEPASDLGLNKLGVLINPYMAQRFKGVDFRTFDFTYKFVPFAPSDNDKIYKIMKIFREISLPSGGARGGGAPLLDYPGEVDITYQWLGGVNKYLHRFKRSVITKLDFNYTGTGMWAMMRNGFPAEVVMDVAFTELDIVVREDVESGY